MASNLGVIIHTIDAARHAVVPSDLASYRFRLEPAAAAEDQADRVGEHVRPVAENVAAPSWRRLARWVFLITGRRHGFEFDFDAISEPRDRFGHVPPRVECGDDLAGRVLLHRGKGIVAGGRAAIAARIARLPLW